MASSSSSSSRRAGAWWWAASAACVLAAVLLGQQPRGAQAAEKGQRPFSRLQATTGSGSGSTAEGDVSVQANAVPGTAGVGVGAGIKTTASERLRPGEKVAFLQNIMRNGADPIDILSQGVNTKGFQLLLRNAEIQHRILEEMPMLAAFDGFKQVRGRRLSDEETNAGFAQGVQNVLNFAKDAFVKIKDPSKTAETIAKMAADPDPAMRDLFRRAKDGDKDAVFELQDRFNEIHFPGVDTKVLREVAASHTFDKLLGMPEVMRFIDRDETLSRIFRDPNFLKNGQQFFKPGHNGLNPDGSAATATTNVGAASKAFAEAFEKVINGDTTTTTTTEAEVADGAAPAVAGQEQQPQP